MSMRLSNPKKLVGKTEGSRQSKEREEIIKKKTTQKIQGQVTAAPFTVVFRAVQ